MDAGVAAEPARGRHQVHRVPRHEHPPVLVALGDVGDAAPARHAFDLDLQVRVPGRGPHQLDQPRLRDVGGGVGGAFRIGDGVAHGGDHQEAALGALLEPEEARQGGVVDVDDAEVAVRQEGREVGLQVDGQRVGEHAAAVHRNAQQLPRAAVGAFAADEIGPAQHVLSAAVHVSDGDVHAVVVLGDRHHFPAIDQRRAHFLRPPAKDRLQARLAHEPAAAGTELVDSFIQRRDQVRQMSPGQGLHGDDGGVGRELAQGLGADLILDGRLPEQLECAHVEEGRPRQSRGNLQLFQGDRRHAVAGEEHGGGQSDHASARDDDRRVQGFRHGLLPLVPLTTTLAKARSNWNSGCCLMHRFPAPGA